MTKEQDSLHHSVELFLNSWGWKIVSDVPEPDMAYDYIEETSGDLCDFDDVLAAIRHVKTSKGY